MKTRASLKSFVNDCSCQGSESAYSSKYVRVLNMALVLNMSGLGICEGSEYASSSKYARVLNIPFSKYKKVLFPKI